MFDQISETEIEEIWKRETSDEDEVTSLNGKHDWKMVRRLCEFINVHDNITNHVVW